MYGQNDLSKIKSDLLTMLGIRSGLRLRKAENKLLHARGVIESTYPSIFTVKLDNQSEFFYIRAAGFLQLY